MGFAVTQGFRNASSSKTSIDRSILGNFAARYFAADVASAAFGATSIVTNPPACGTDSGTPVIGIQTSSNSAITYGVFQEPDGRESLVRNVCSGSVSGALDTDGPDPPRNH